MIRDLINTPANDMGPDALEAATLALSHTHGARVEVIRGDDLIDQNYPLIHAVGRASTQTPRLIDMHWGEAGPQITLVGKGVCFDTGGLNLKPGTSMGLMKKDMGGAANVLGLAHMIMALKGAGAAAGADSGGGKQRQRRKLPPRRHPDPRARGLPSRSTTPMPRAGWCWPMPCAAVPRPRPT